MRLFADQQQRHRLATVAPHREVEQRAAQQRHHDVDDLRGYAGEVEDGQGLARDGYADDAGDHIGQRVAH